MHEACYCNNSMACMAVYSSSFIALYSVEGCSTPLFDTQVDKVMLVVPVFLLFNADGPRNSQ